MAEVMARVAADNVAAESDGRPERTSYLPHVSITCLMDMGNGAALVHRDDKSERLVPMPLFGHWAKKAWGSYYKLSKKRIVPRLPGM
jgi:sulfide:quinone oxidoreductase